MGAKQLISALVFALLLIFFSATLFFVFNGAPVQISHLRENPIFYLSEALNTLSLSWMKPINGGERQEREEEESAKTLKNNMNIPLEPDLATCHRSLSDADVPVYCCPPKPESEESVIDYKFPDPSLPRRIRRPAHLVDEEYISKYEKAISAMKTYPYDDPFNWMRQANMHCLYCTGAYNQHNSSALFKIHRSWFFFPWHRIFIHFHERFIGKLIGDDTFALPYWNWDAPPGMKIPDFYFNGAFVDADRDAGHLPEVVDDSFDYVEKGLGSEEMVASNLAFMYNQMVSGAKKVELFMGCPRRFGEEGDCDGPGTIEVAPHNALHTWVGSNLQPERENMGAFYSAARDPLFYSHHANIDRLWSVWKRLRGHEPEYQDPVWLDTYLYFHNENRQLVRIKIRDCLDHTKLGYDYEDADLPWLNARPKPSIPPLKAREILKTRNANTNNTNGLRIITSTQTGVADFGLGGRSLASTIRVQITRPKRGRSKKEKEEEEEVLVVYGIDIKKDTYVKFDVLINAVEEEATGPECREFAGTFVNVRHGVRLVMKEGDSKVKRKGNLKVGISEVLEDLEAEEEESIWVSLVPRGGTGVNTSVDGVRIEYMS